MAADEKTISLFVSLQLFQALSGSNHPGSHTLSLIFILGVEIEDIQLKALHHQGTDLNSSSSQATGKTNEHD